MIERLVLKNFTAFKSIDLDLSARINIIIGENGTGKTHLLKAAYGLCSGNARVLGIPSVSQEAIQEALTAKLVGLFMPLDDRLGEMHHREATDPALVEGHFTFDKSVAASFDRGSASVMIETNELYEHYTWEPVFIPTKEVLSFMQGFTSLYDRREISFDETYRDICVQLDLPKVRQGELRDTSKRVLDRIEQICGGRFIFHGGGRVTFKTQYGEYSANSVAEGFRKLGILSRLIETGSIIDNVSGPLFWDEPESNMNPKLMRTLVEILLELSRKGQQVILATHDYTLLKWFDLLTDKEKKDHVRYHVLYRDPDSKEVFADSTDEYLAISPNAIADTFTELTVAHAKSRLGVSLDA